MFLMFTRDVWVSASVAPRHFLFMQNYHLEKHLALSRRVLFMNNLPMSRNIEQSTLLNHCSKLSAFNSNETYLH